MNLKKTLLIALIASLTISALIAIVVFLAGSFGDIQRKLLFTTLTIAGYSFTGLASSALFNRRRLVPLGILGIAISVVGIIYTTALIWEIIRWSSDWDFKLLVILIILAVSVAHCSLLLLTRSNVLLVNACLGLTIVCILTVALMLVRLIAFAFPDDPGDFALRLLGVFAVLDVLGTIVTPILKKLNP